MKLLYCIPSLETAGGTERVLTTKINYLAEKGFAVYVVLTEKQSNKPFFPLHESIVVINLAIDFKKSDKSMFLFKILKYMYKSHVYNKRLSSLLFEIRPDITTTLLSHEVDFLYKIKDGSVKIGECHFNKNFRFLFAQNATTTNRLKQFIANYRNKQLLESVKKLNYLVVLTHDDYTNWTEIQNRSTIPNPCSFQSIEKSTCRNKNIIMVGRYAREKGGDLLLSVWKDIESKHPNWNLYIYGDGEERTNWENIVAKERMKNVHLEFPVENVEKVFIESSIAVLPSRFEGFGLVIVEAMECGVPVVAFDCPSGPREIITQNTDGLLVKSGDLIGLKNAILSMIEQPLKRINMGKNSQIKASKYSLDTIMGKWIQLYKSFE